MRTSAPIHTKPAHVGMLNKALGVPEGKPISIGDLMKTKGTGKRASKPAAVKEEKAEVVTESADKWNKKKAC